MVLCTGCSVKDIIESEVDEFDTVAHQNKHCVETAEKVYDAIKERDAQKLKDTLCKKVMDKKTLDDDIQSLFDFVSGDIESYRYITDPATSEEIRDGEIVRLNGYPTIKDVKTSDGTVYNITVWVVLIYTDEDWEGVTKVSIRKEGSDKYRKVGMEFDY